MDEIQRINRELAAARDFFRRVVEIIPKFDVTNPEILPYGLKPHTRSISWIAEQVIVQQAKYNCGKLNVLDVDFDFPDTSLHDCVILPSRNRKIYVNIKVTKASGKTSAKNDIAAVEKLYMQYRANRSYRLVYAVFGLTFNNTEIQFVDESIHTFSPQFLPIYVNPRNDKIQANYYAIPEERTRASFLDLLKSASGSIVLP